MTHTDAFLHDILAHLDDDAPRLIFADWLEEQGDANSVARAEFIRIPCALAAGQLSQERQAQLRGREERWLELHYPDLGAARQCVIANSPLLRQLAFGR